MANSIVCAQHFLTACGQHVGRQKSYAMQVMCCVHTSECCVYVQSLTSVMCVAQCLICYKNKVVTHMQLLSTESVACRLWPRPLSFFSTVDDASQEVCVLLQPDF